MEFKPWISAIRLRTLPLAVSCILVGAGIAWKKNTFDWTIITLTITTTVLLQILSNLANDLGDGLKGTDNENRIGPARAIQSGEISVKSMKFAVLSCSLLAFTSGLILLINALDPGWEFYLLFSIGIAGIAASIKYTLGKNAYGYFGFGDLFVFVFFGLIGVLGTVYLQTKTIDWIDVIPAVAVGMLCVGVLNLNNMRDFKSDKSSNKRTLVVIMGPAAAKIYHSLLTLIPVTLLFGYLVNIQSGFDSLALIIPFILLLSAVIRIHKTNKAADLDPELRKLALTTFLAAMLFTASLVIPL